MNTSASFPSVLFRPVDQYIRSLLQLTRRVVLSLFFGLFFSGALATPGVPVAGNPVFLENFENSPNNSATGAKSYTTTGGAVQYVGATPAGQAYSGSNDWINANYCNGVVLSANNSTQPAWTISGADDKCRISSGAQSYGAIRTLARGMGVLFGGNDLSRGQFGAG